MSSKINRLVSIVRATLLFLIIFNSLILEMQCFGLKYTKAFHAYIGVQLLLLILTTLFLQFEKDIYKKRKIDRSALITCIALVLYTFISDILVDKDYRFSGVLVFIVLFLFGYSIYCRQLFSIIISEFYASISFFLVVLTILSLIIMKSNGDGRFSGPIDNPSVYALYLCSVWAVLLGVLEDNLNNKRRGSALVLTLVELLTTLVLMVLSQSLTPMIALTAVTFLWLFRRIAIQKGMNTAIKIIIVVGILGIVVLAGTIFFIRNTGVASDSRLVQKLQSADLSSFLSGRDYYWRRYFSEMNLFGHGKKPFLWDHRILPHNALIGMMYWYGVPCVVPYIIMMMMAVEKSWRYANTKLPYAAVPFYCIVSFIIMSMADNVEQPFVWLPWIACYLMMAPILIMPVEEIEALKKANTDICVKESDQV